jgi:hypothetical protein
MLLRIPAWTLSLGLLATAAWAQPSTPSGDESARMMPEVRGRIAWVDHRSEVTRIDHQARLIGFEDGRVYRVTPDTAIFMDNQPVTIKELRPGQSVVIQSGQAVGLREGQYAAGEAGPSDAAGYPPAGDQTSGLRHTLYGRVEDIDMDGTVQIETGSDTFGKDSLKIRLSPEVARQLRKGDPVQLEVTLGAGAAPAAAPRIR